MRAPFDPSLFKKYGACLIVLDLVQCRLMTGKVSNPRSRIQDPGLMNDSVLEFTTLVCRRNGPREQKCV